MGNLYITVEEFMKQIGSSHVDIEPSVYGGAAMQISNAKQILILLIQKNGEVSGRISDG